MDLYYVGLPNKTYGVCDWVSGLWYRCYAYLQKQLMKKNFTAIMSQLWLIN